MSNIVKGSGLLYTTGIPNTIPSTAHDSEFAIDINGNQYAWNRTTSVWDNLGQGIEIATSSIAPTHVPSKFRPRFVITPTRELYFYSGSWGLINPTSSGGDGNGIYSGSGTVPDGTVATVSGSLTYTLIIDGKTSSNFNINYANERFAFVVANDSISIGTPNGGKRITITDTFLEISDSSLNNEGIRYADDYSATIKENDRSIPDVGTVKQIARPYKVYTALLTQSGTDDPVATVLENTLSGTPVWTRNDVGDYTCDVGAIEANTENKFMAFGQYIQNPTVIIIINTEADVDGIVQVYTYENTNIVDGMLYKTPIEIRVYP